MRYLLTVSLLLFTLSAQAFFTQEKDFLPVEKAFQLTLTEGEQQAALNWQIKPGYYLYKHSIKAVDGQQQTLALDIPKGTENEDEFFGKTEIYHHNLQIPIDVDHPQPLAVTWQGCAEAGLCYPPQTTELNFSSTAANTASSAGTALAEDQGIADRLANAGLMANIGAFFVMGLLLAFTPCMLPMLPILSSVIAGSKPGGWQGARLGFAFIVPMALVYAVLGVIAAQLGSNLSAAMQNPWLLIPFASLFILLALAQFGLFTLQLPGFIRNRLQERDQKMQGGSLLGAAGLGVFSALLVGPCMTAPLAGALLYIGQSGNSTTGGLALFSLGIGSGLPLLLAMSFGMRWLPKPGEWMQAVNKVFAYALLAAAIFIIRPIVSEALIMALWGTLTLAVALQIGSSKNQRFISRYLGLLLGIYASMLLFGAASGGHDPLNPLAHFKQGTNTAATLNLDAVRYADPQDINQQLEQAKHAQQWVILDFYADWCISCKVMERTVFGQPEVQSAIDGMRFLQPDVTDNNKAQQELLANYSIMGPPTILFIAPNGEEVRAARITGEVNAQQFLAQLNLAKESVK